MITRQINELEYFDSLKIFSRVFEKNFNVTQSRQDFIEKIKESPNNRKEKYFTQRFACFEDDNKSMMGFLAIVPYDVFFGANICKMGGIADVATLPEHRNKGVINHCFDKALNYMYSQDYTLSYLYPFSFDFYRHYGYETSGEYINYEMDFNCLQNIDVTGHFIFVDDQNTMLKYIKEIRDNMPKYNLLSTFDEIDFTGYIKDVNLTHNFFNYVYLDANNNAKGYLRYSKKEVLSTKVHKSIMNIDKFIFSDTEGLKGLLYTAKKCSATYGNLSINLPFDLNIDEFIKETEYYHYVATIRNRGMVRVINVQKALQMAKYKGSGEISIKIEDKQIPQNNHNFKVTYQQGKAVSVEKVDNFDISLTIPQFSRLILGSCSDYDISRLSYIDKTQLDKINNVFYKKAVVILDGF